MKVVLLVNTAADNMVAKILWRVLDLLWFVLSTDYTDWFI